MCSTNSRSLIKLMSISVMLTISSSAYLFYCHQGLFQWNHLFASGGPSIRASASASVLPMNSQGWFPLGLTSLISFLSKGLLRVFSSTFSLVIYFIHSSVCMTYIDFFNFSCLKKNHIYALERNLSKILIVFIPVQWDYKQCLLSS